MKMPAIYVAHDRHEVQQLATQVIEISSGRVAGIKAVTETSASAPNPS
jgi:ABC-type molybdate transport system ATPase subunit